MSVGTCRSELTSAVPTSPWNRAARWWQLLCHHHPSQLAMRLLRTAHSRSARTLWHRRLQRPVGAPPALRGHAELASLSQRKLAARDGEESRAGARRVREGCFRFLHQEFVLPDPLDWRLEGVPEATHLWRFHLHYHEFLLDLAAEGRHTGDPSWATKAWALVLDWIDRNRLDDRRVLADAWHPYCIARRLPVWIHLWSAAPPDAETGRRVLASMWGQARYLESHLEWDLGGNHLLEDLRALALVGAFFEGPDADRWLQKAAKLLRKQLAEQILPHGEHFERSPMYHAEMLEAVLDVRDAVAGLQPELAALCHDTAARMAAFLRGILHPDDEIPLLGDSCLGQSMPLEMLLGWADQEVADRQTTGTRPAAGSAGATQVGDYWVYRSGEGFVLFDTGPVGPDHLPAHAHADLLSLEASLHGRRLIVDSGVYNYEDDAMRRYCRASAAHNVLQVDGSDQCDMWSRFRMGYRGWPSARAFGEEAGFCWARAEHNAYRRLGVPAIGRWLACRPGGPWFSVDWAKGSGRHELTAWLHFHPDVAVQQTADDELCLALGPMAIRLRWLTPGKVTLVDGWYCPQIGLRHPAPVVRWQASDTLPTVCGWYLTWGENEGTASLERPLSPNPTLVWRERNQCIRLEPLGQSP